eukprot:6205377-Pleurochrysis_carterae.AAC.3
MHVSLQVRPVQLTLEPCCATKPWQAILTRPGLISALSDDLVRAVAEWCAPTLSRANLGCACVPVRACARARAGGLACVAARGLLSCEIGCALAYVLARALRVTKRVVVQSCTCVCRSCMSLPGCARDTACACLCAWLCVCWRTRSPMKRAHHSV